MKTLVPSGTVPQAGEIVNVVAVLLAISRDSVPRPCGR